MSNCSINTECQCEALVSAIKDVLEARNDDLCSFPSAFTAAKVFGYQYPRMSEALDHAFELINSLQPEDELT